MSTQFIRISKSAAKKLFASGKPVYFCPCKMRPGYPFNMAWLCFPQEYIEKATILSKPYSDGTMSDLFDGTIEKTAWNLAYNNWSHYNANYETGYYAHYYVERS